MDQIAKVFVQGGQLIVSDSPSQLVTILGSCVAVCLWDRQTKTGGMNHYLLPTSSNGGNFADGGITATKMLIQSMVKRSSKINNLEAKIFGGGNRFFDHNFLVVGPKNVDVAESVLREAGIPIVVNDTGGTDGRKIYFNTETGNVDVVLIK